MSLIIEKCVKHWLNVAIDATKDPSKVGRMLTIQEFIQYTHFKVDNFAMTKFYYNVNNEIPIYIDESIIKWFKYKGTYFNQKSKIRNILNTNFAEYKNIYWFEYSNQEYETFYTENSRLLMSNLENNTEPSKLYPDPSEFKHKNQTKHMIVHPIVFKHVVLMADTQNSMNIRDYYITLEELIKKYSQYQTEAIKNENMSLIQTLKETNNLMIVNEKKADEERKKADEERRNAAQRFGQLLDIAENTQTTLQSVARNQVEVSILRPDKRHTFIILKDNDGESLTPYYAIRSQNGSSDKIINNIRTRRNRDMSVFVELDQPNSVAFFNIIKSELCDNIERVGQWFNIVGMSEDEFKTKITDINKRRTREMRRRS